MNNEKTLKSIIDKYKLDEPVPADVRMAMEKSKKENLIRILKGDAGRAIFTSLAVSFFLWIKKFGISISIAKSAAAVAAALIIGAGAITAAGIYTTFKISEYISSQSRQAENSQNSTAASSEHLQTGTQPAQEIISYSVAVQPIDMDDTTGEILTKYRNKFIQSLRNIKGANAAVKLEELDEYHISGKTLSISIIKLDEKSEPDKKESTYRISAKIISSSSSQVLMHASVTAEGENRISEAIETLAEKISSKL